MDYTTVTIIEDAVLIVESAQQGPTGPVGPPGAAGAVNYRAAEALGGHQAIILDTNGEAISADSTNYFHANVVGLTTNAAIIGDNVQVVSKGLMEHSGWTLTVGQPVYLGLSGSVTQVMPASAVFMKVLGTAIAVTRINVDLQPAIF